MSVLALEGAISFGTLALACLLAKLLTSKALKFQGSLRSTVPSNRSAVSPQAKNLRLLSLLSKGLGWHG